ncbi:hypothetical protein MXEN_14426 [Mycobacterium xenopi RIVM700367]|uniref:Lipoprotein n=1 Tax=Mycobacterium xenopi TaxID=1789 RepID=A0AAD1GZD7_MYCXE|nr:hypothetical protein [Mycobacterium xenopi]EID12267.1 hypothetical protein MXEN_14426 [Mycobacterium xenopi RIVM700367]ORX22105.1 hypothetical protein AWC32_19910 [Mycobacterium xenopi]BBU20654.1 hypothetical protein MYXE_04430 [Mycobacterium xenopi]SPX79441.1 Uncharacterised protein [Mycobacterium xenopi]
MRIAASRLLAALLAVLTLSACVMPGGGRGGDVIVYEAGRVLARLTLSELQHLPQAEVVTPQSRGTRVQKGPTVRCVIHAAGVTNVESLRVEGRDPAQTLSAAELDNQVILALTKRNTVKLAGAQLDIERWVRDVTALVVNP